MRRQRFSAEKPTAEKQQRRKKIACSGQIEETFWELILINIP